MVSDLGDFLVQKHDVFGVILQNWMVIAIVMVITVCLSNFTKDRFD